MLKSLRIENFALIDEANIEFDSGFTVITGETGSGKSILLNALNLILGERANFTVIGKLKDKSVVEGLIDLKDFDLHNFFEENELDYFDQTILRREINKQGRSRAFINDIPVQLGVLKELCSRLIHIHSQYNTLELKDINFQMEVLDILAGTRPLKLDYEKKFHSFQQKKTELYQQEEELLKLTASADYNRFQLTELELLDPDDTNFEDLRSQLLEQESADDLQRIFALYADSIQEDGGILDRLNVLRTASLNFKLDHAKVTDLNDRLNSVILELKDIAEFAQRELEAVEIDPQKIMELSSKLDEFNKLLHKHRLNSQEELIAYRDKLMEESSNTQSLEESIAALKKEIKSAEEELMNLALELQRKREQAIPDIVHTIEGALDQLKLKGTRLIFDLKQLDELKTNGISRLEMLFSPNAGIDPVPIHQAASGGELSRLMLTLQNLISGKMKLQTILFDEIDTGVSGDVAQKIGATLKTMGENMQVIAITHLPQVAAKGTQHLRVDKYMEAGQTKSRVVELTGNDKVSEIARLMSGDEITDAAMQNAKSLMSS